MKTSRTIVAALGLAAAIGLTATSQAWAQYYHHYHGGYPYYRPYFAGPVEPGYVLPGYVYDGGMAYAYAPRPWVSRSYRSTLSPGSQNYVPSFDR